MKKVISALFFISLVSCGLYASKYPKPSGWVNDFAGAIDPVYKEKMTSVITELDQKTSSEISVVTLSNLQGDTIDNAAVNLFQEWGIGKKGKDNGVLIIASIEDKKVRIEVGYGLEGILPDGVVGGILDSYVIPEFKKGDYGKGLMLGTMAVAFTVAKDQGVTLTGETLYANELAPGKPSVLKMALNIILLLLLAILFIKNPLLFLFFLGMGGGGRSSGGGFGGGFGGFGGGMSGGGGSSRGW